MASANESHSSHGELWTAEAVTKDLVAKHSQTGSMFKGVLLITGIMLLLGIIGVVLRLSSGVSNTALWGYHAGVLAFLLSTASAAPMVAVGPRIAKAHWRRPLSRAAEMWSVAGLISLLMFIPLLWALPSLDNGRRSFWFWHEGEVFGYSPHLWSTLAILGLVVLGFMLLWVSSLPDLAYFRDHGTGNAKKWGQRLAGGWMGTSQQWFFLHHRMGILGALYFIMLITVHFFITVDFLMTLVPGWIDALYPATFTANSLQAAFATTMLTMWALKKFGGYDEYFGYDQFWVLGKLMFASSLLWVWFWFSSFNVFWYGKKPNEQFVLTLFVSGPYVWVFFVTFATVFLIPMWTMIWNPVRRSEWGPPIIAVSVLIGTFLDRIRLFVASYSVSGNSGDIHSVPGVPSFHGPDGIDVLIIVGALGGAVFLFLLMSRVFPIMNIWEQRELTLYKRHKKFHRTEVLVLGKPD